MTQTKIPKSNRMRNILVILTALVLLAVAAVPATATGANITAFSIIGSNTGPSTGTVINTAAQTVAVTVLNGTELSSMVASFTLDSGATATVNGVTQESEENENDFTGSVTYHVTGTDVSKDWTVTVTPAIGGSTAADFTSYSIPNQVIASQIRILDGAVIVTMPFGTDTTNLTATYTTSAGVTSVKVNGVAQTSGTTKNDFSDYYGLDYVIAAEAGNTKTWNVEVRVRDNPPNFTAFSLPSVPGAGTAVITNTSLTTGTVTITVPYGTNVAALVPTFSQTDGTAWIGSTEQVSGSTPVDFTNSVTYDLVAGDTYTTKVWTVTVIVSSNTAAEITAFSVPGQTGTATINGANQWVNMTVPWNTDVSSLAATFTLSDHASAKIDATPQTSGVTHNNFGSPLTYNITAQDGVHYKKWIVTVTQAQNTAAEFTSFTLPGQVDGSTIINTGTASNGTIQVTMPTGGVVSSLVATFILTPSATARIGVTPQQSGITSNSYVSDVQYIVTAPNGQTTKTWTVHIVFAPSTQAEILTYSLPGQFGSSRITSGHATVNVTMPSGTSLSSRAANFTLSGGAAATNVSGVTQVSGVSLNDFTHPVTYKVTAADAITNKTWTVNAVIVEFATFTLPVQSGPTVINTTARTVNLSVPYGTSLTSLPATFTITSGATTVRIGSTVQESGATTNNFGSPVTYLITGQDGDVMTWTVNVRTLPNTATDVTSFTLPGQIGSTAINNATNPSTVALTIAYVRNMNLAAAFTLSDGATLNVSTTRQVSGVTLNNFTDPVLYVITAQDGSTTKNLQVTVSRAPNSAAEIASFSLPGVAGSGSGKINSTLGTVNITVPNGTAVTSLVPSFTQSDYATVRVGGISQVSGSTPQDFTNPVRYVVSAQDGTNKNWDVYVTIGMVPDKLGISKDGAWYLDVSGDGIWNTGDQFSVFGSSGVQAVPGDWNGDGKTEKAVFLNGGWWIDSNGNGVWDAGDTHYAFGSTGVQAVPGDWNKDGKTEAAVFLNGGWWIDSNGNGVWDAGDTYYSFGSTGVQAVPGDWNGDGKTEVAVFKNGGWWIDSTGNGVWDAGDTYYTFGSTGVKPVVGDWNGNGVSKVAVYLNGGWWLDSNGNGVWDTGDLYNGFGSSGWTPVAGKW
jgi:hypothetical protein